MAHGGLDPSSEDMWVSSKQPGSFYETRGFLELGLILPPEECFLKPPHFEMSGQREGR